MNFESYAFYFDSYALNFASYMLNFCSYLHNVKLKIHLRSSVHTQLGSYLTENPRRPPVQRPTA